MIKIHTEKVVDKDGIACRKIQTIEGGLHSDSDLPKQYTDGEPYVRIWKDCASVFSVKDFAGTVSEAAFQKMLEHIRISGERLHAIKEKHRQLRDAWKGQEVFVI